MDGGSKPSSAQAGAEAANADGATSSANGNVSRNPAVTEADKPPQSPHIGGVLVRGDSFGPFVFQHQFTRENPGKLWDFYEKPASNGTLGEGSFGKVFRSVCKQTHLLRAVKSIEIRRMKNPEKFQRELDIAKQLDHPNVVRLFETFRDAQNFYLVMELCEGGELFDRITEHNHGFDESHAAHYIQQIVSSLAYLHAHRFAHRDVKPENFLFHGKSPDSALKLVDFGLSTQFEPGVPMHTKVGTVYYVCPELLTGNYSEKCDVWSAGVIAYILFCGFPPFSGDHDREVLQKVKKGTFSFTSPWWDKVSPDAKDLIKKMLTVDVDQRPSAEEVLAEPWLKKKGSPEGVVIGKDFVERLQAFRTSTKLKKVALTAIAQQLPDESIEALQNVFRSLDGNGDGMLSYEEIRTGLASHGLTVPDDFEALLKAIDCNGSAALDYTEFLAALIEQRLYMQRDVCWAAFCVFDLNGDGKITRSDLGQVLNRGSVKKSLGDRQIDRLIKEADLDGDGCIDFEEFCAMMKPKLVQPGVKRRLCVKTSVSQSPTVKRARTCKDLGAVSFVEDV